jgi:hypothetical protein
MDETQVVTKSENVLPMTALLERAEKVLMDITDPVRLEELRKDCDNACGTPQQKRVFRIYAEPARELLREIQNYLTFHI